MIKHKAGHDLPISNGYGHQGTRRDGYTNLTVYCGRCKESYTPDRAWVARYFAAEKKEVERQIGKGYATRGSLVDLDDERARVLAAITVRRRGAA